MEHHGEPQGDPCTSSCFIGETQLTSIPNAPGASCGGRPLICRGPARGASLGLCGAGLRAAKEFLDNAHLAHRIDKLVWDEGHNSHDRWDWHIYTYIEGT